jgi:hypothetical protein
MRCGSVPTTSWVGYRKTVGPACVRFMRYVKLNARESRVESTSEERTL